MNAQINNSPELDVSELTALLAEHGYIAIFWHIDDVKEVRPDLTDEQCFEVLQQCDDEHDALVGLDLDLVRIHASELFPETDEVTS